MIKRITLFAVYAALAFGLFWLFMANGEGTAAPVAVVGSWGILFARLIWPKGAGILMFIIVYYAFLLALTTKLSRGTAGAFPFLTVSVQISGSILAVLTSNLHPPMRGMPMAFVYLISASLVLLYLWIDWEFAKEMGPLEEQAK